MGTARKTAASKPRRSAKPKAPTKAELTVDTKEVIATQAGYFDAYREPGDIFLVPKTEMRHKIDKDGNRTEVEVETSASWFEDYGDDAEDGFDPDATYGQNPQAPTKYDVQHPNAAPLPSKEELQSQARKVKVGHDESFVASNAPSDTNKALQSPSKTE